MRVLVTWKFVSQLRRPIMQPSDLTSKAFTSAPSPGLFSQFSIPMAYAYTPLHLNPTTTYYQIIAKLLYKENINAGAKKFPLYLNLPAVGEVPIRANFRLYPPYTLITTVNLPIEVADLAELFDIRRLGRAGSLRDLVQTSVTLAESHDHRNLVDPPRLQVYPSMHIQLPTADSGARDFWRDNKSLLSGLIIGNDRYLDMAEDIAAKLESKNSEFNKKSLATLLLADKQGAVFLSSADKTEHAFNKATSLIEVALAMKQFFDIYLTFRPDSEEFFDLIFLRTRSWIRSSGAIFSSSVSNKFYWDLLVTEFGLDKNVSLIQHDNPWLEDHLRENSRYFAAISSEWWKQPTFASSISLIAPGQGTKSLQSVTDPELRASILQDIKEADRSLASRNFKSAVVMAGAACEALLLAVLLERTNLDKNRLLREGFSQYVEHVKNEKISIDAATLAVAEHTLRQWRNLVHPGKQIRVNVAIDEHKARVAVSGLYALVAEIDK